jgi:hypothetical protein
MPLMKRPIILVWAAFVAALLIALPAAAANGRSVKGQIASISDTAIAIQSPSSIVTTCALTNSSPSLTDFKAGDRVQAICLGSRGHLWLSRIRKLGDTAPLGPHDQDGTTTFGGAITDLGGASITVHDGDRDLTCKLDPSSPSTDGYKVGQHVRIACSGGSLVAIAPVTAADAGRYFVGNVSALDVNSITLATEHGPATCTIADGSPSTADVHVGDRIGMGCKTSTMQLVLIRKLDGDGTTTPPAPPATEPTHTTTGARGTLSALSDSSVSVVTDGGTVTCQRGPASPSLGDYRVGDHVAMTCVDGIITQFARVT